MQWSKMIGSLALQNTKRIWKPVERFRRCACNIASLQPQAQKLEVFLYSGESAGKEDERKDLVQASVLGELIRLGLVSSQ